MELTARNPVHIEYSRFSSLHSLIGDRWTVMIVLTLSQPHPGRRAVGIRNPEPDRTLTFFRKGDIRGGSRSPARPHLAVSVPARYVILHTDDPIRNAREYVR